LIAYCSTVGQSQALSFEVASIKPNVSGLRGSGFPPPKDGRFNATNVTLKDLILYAYHLQGFQLSGTQGWMESDHYDVVAKAEGTATENEIRRMVQPLLADHFKLSVHQGEKQLPIYALVIARDGLKMPHTTQDCSVPGTRDMPCGGFRVSERSQLAGRNVPIGELIDVLGFFTGRHIIDKTGLNGNFDIRLQWSPDETLAFGPESAAKSDDPSGASLFTALQQQLGLKLESQKGPVPMLIVDRAEKPPLN
jgi:uncharacterized protein (TIGR03435 family)